MRIARYLWMPVVLCAVVLCFFPLRQARASQADGLTLGATAGAGQDVISWWLYGTLGHTPVTAFIVDANTHQEISVEDVSWQWMIEAIWYDDGNGPQEYWSGSSSYYPGGECYLWFGESGDWDSEAGDTAQATNLCYFLAPPGDWVVTVRCYATFSDESYLASDLVNVAFHVYDDGNVVVWDRTANEYSGDWSYYAEIAGGGLASDAHHTAVLVMSGEAYGAVWVSLEGGAGVSLNARLEIGNTTIYAGNGGWVYTDEYGQCTGELYSSDVVYDGVTIRAGEIGRADVGFGWNTCLGEDSWWLSPDEIVLDDYIGVMALFSMNDTPVDGHQLYFYVDWVLTEDNYGNVIPHDCETEDLSGYAYFPEPEATTAENTASANLYVQDRPELIYIHMTYMDLSVWEWEW